MWKINTIGVRSDNFFSRLRQIGPGAMVAAAFIGPGTVTTATISGAGYGYTLLWAITFSIIATYILQEMSARLGVIAQMGVGKALRQKVTGKGIRILTYFLVLGAILVGNAAYEAGNITGAALGFDLKYNLVGVSFNPLIPAIGLVAFLLLYTGKYKLIEKSLVAMVSLMGVVFIAAAVLTGPDWGHVLKGMFTPAIPDGSALMAIGLIGTTVVPYNLFLHASAASRRWHNPEELNTARWDAILSVVLGGMITMAILITSAMAFEGTDSQVNNIGDLSRQLVPLMGDHADTFISFGFLAAGLSSSVTAPLAAAFATTELLGWSDDMRSARFKWIWASVILIGLLFASAGIRPTAVILFAQVANGLLLPIIATFLLWLANDQAIMGDHVNSKGINAISVIIILLTLLLGIKGILTALGIL